MKRYKWLAFLITIAAFVLLAGCAEGTGHVTIHKDGSADFQINVRLDSRAQTLLGGTMEEIAERKAAEQGFSFKSYRTKSYVEYRFKRTFPTVEDLASVLSRDGGNKVEVSKEKHWFYTKYKVSGEIDMDSYTVGLMKKAKQFKLGEPLLRLFLQQFTFDFKLTLPIDMYGDNNAHQAAGRTLTWHLPLTDAQPIYFEFYAPALSRILAAAGLIVCVAAAAAVILIRRRKRRRKT